MKCMPCPFAWLRKRKRKRKSYASGSHLKRQIKEGPTPPPQGLELGTPWIQIQQDECPCLEEGT
eukprot:537930-Pelagomonas_calceolata.AAC.2